jgi:hypothetical protein
MLTFILSMLLLNNITSDCHQFCNGCTASDSYDECSKCEDGYVNIFNEPRKCRDPNAVNDGFFFDVMTRSFKRCDSMCASCFAETNNDCYVCAENMVNIFGEEHQCRDPKEIYDGIYFDVKYRTFKPCDLYCARCTGPNSDNCITR